jgi:glycosyltransferase involved in cell wall biosynthesis
VIALSYGKSRRCINNLSNLPSVLLVGNFLSSAGRNPSVSEDLSVRLTARGWKVVTTSAKPSRLSRLFDTIGCIWRNRHAYQIANVEVYSGLAFRLAEAACWTLRRAGKPYILTLHGGNLPEFSASQSRRVKKLLNSAVCVTAPSRYLQETMQSYREDIRLLPNPINIESYSFRLRAHSAPRLIWLRAFNDAYNPEMAIRTLQRLVSDFPNIQLTMIGPDKGDGSFQRTQQLTCDLNVQEHVTFPGGIPKSAVNAALNQGDIFINTTNYDNTPISILEAWACGLCVVSTNVGGLPYLMEHDANALLVPANDDLAMSQAVARLIHEPLLSTKLSGQGRAVVEGFDWSRVLPRWEALFCEFACPILAS